MHIVPNPKNSISIINCINRFGQTDFLYLRKTTTTDEMCPACADALLQMACHSVNAVVVLNVIFVLLYRQIKALCLISSEITKII